MTGDKKIKVGNGWFDPKAVLSNYKTVDSFVKAYSSVVSPAELKAFYEEISGGKKPSKEAQVQ